MIANFIHSDDVIIGGLYWVHAIVLHNKVYIIHVMKYGSELASQFVSPLWEIIVILLHLHLFLFRGFWGVTPSGLHDGRIPISRTLDFSNFQIFRTKTFASL